MKLYDPTKTALDLRPMRFDVSGDRVTGEFDHISTPELTLIEKKSSVIPWFVLGFVVAVGCMLFGYLGALIAMAK